MRFGATFFLIAFFCQLFLSCQSQPVWTQLSLDNQKKAREFLQGKIDINSPDKDVQGLGRAPIHMAIDLVDDTLVKFIIDLGADVHRKDHEGRTPLRITWDNFEKLNRLEAEQRTIVNNTGTWKIVRNRAVAELEQITRNREANNKIVRLLVEAGADIHENNSVLARNILNRGGEYLFAILTPDSVKATNPQGRTLLHLAAEMENYSVVRYIADTDEGQSVDKQDNTGKTALDIVLSRPESINALKTAEQLILAGALSENPLFRYLAPAVYNSDYQIGDAVGNTPLHNAALGNYRGFVQYLLEKKVNPNIPNAAGSTPLHEAVRMGHIDILELLLSGGADINARDSLGNTAMHLAVPLEWHREVLNFLILHRANLNLQNEQGDTPLHALISLHRDTELIQRLLAGGADVFSRNSEGKTPLYLAVQENMVPYIAPLLSYSSDIFTADNRGIPPFDLAIRTKSPTLPALVTPETVYYRDGAGNTVLHRAIGNHGNTELINLIMERGAWINARNHEGDTGLHLAIRQNAEESGKFLLSSPYGPDLFIANVLGETPLSLIFSPGGLREWALTPAAITARDKLGGTMLHYAAMWKLNTFIPIIIRKGAALEAKNYAGETPVFEAVKVNAPSTIQTLIGSGASFSVRNNRGDTPLHTAIYRNALAAAETLIKAGADVNAPNGLNQKAPLHEAVRLGMFRFERLLIDSHANLEVRDNEGFTPLMEAIRLGATGSAERLLEDRADPMTRDIRGNTPLHTAIAMDRLDLVTLILDRDADIHAQNLSGKSPFQMALAAVESPHILRALIGGGRVRRADRSGRFLLHIAIAEAAPRLMLEIILEQGGSVDALDPQGRTPLHLAAAAEAWDTARLLVRSGADVFARANDGSIPAHTVLDKGRTAIQALFDGIAIAARDRQGDTVLHFAARYEGAGEETIGLLLELGANKTIRNHAGKNPLQIARDTNRSINIVRLLD